MSDDRNEFDVGSGDDSLSGRDDDPAGTHVEDMQSLMDAQEVGFKALRRRQTTKGVVVSVREDVVLVDVGTKSEGIIPRDELAEIGEEPPVLSYGQEILVQVLEPDSREGPVLSLRRARREQAWVDLEELGRDGAIITAVVVDHNRGGAILDVRGLRGFIPLSQLSSLPPASPAAEGDDTQERLSQLHGQRLTVKVLEADQNHNRLILSERAASDELRAQRRAELLAQIEPGQIRQGKVRSVTNFGAFIDLGGADGLVHVSEMSYDRVQDPRTVVKPGDEVDVYVLEIRPEDGRISLSMKRASLDPWSLLPQRYEAGQIVDVTVTRLMQFGAFAQVEPGVEGLIHISELADVAPKDPSSVVQPGETARAKIIHIDLRERKLGLSLRQVNPAPKTEEMSVEEWHAEQDKQFESAPSAFEGLSELRQDEPAGDSSAEPADSEPEPAQEASLPVSDSARETEEENTAGGEDAQPAEAVNEQAAADAAQDSDVPESEEGPKPARRSSRKAKETTSEEASEADVIDAVSPTV